MDYAAGIAAAVIGGIADHIGVLIQKAAVNRSPRGKTLIGTLVRNPVWLGGFALQFTVGTPLAVIAVGLIGPAIVPGLMSIGLVVLALGAVVIHKERVKASEAAGIASVILAVTAFGLSRLSIDVHALSMKEPSLLLRAGAFAGAVTAAAFACGRAAARISRTNADAASALYAARAGLLFNLGSLGLGFITAGMARLARGLLDPVECIVTAAAAAVAGGGSIAGLAATQHALSHGRAAVAIPLQNGVSQTLPILVFFVVYRPYTPSAEQLAFLAAACALLVTGAVLLTGRLREEAAPPTGEPERPSRPQNGQGT